MLRDGKEDVAKSNKNKDKKDAGSTYTYKSVLCIVVSFLYGLATSPSALFLLQIAR